MAQVGFEADLLGHVFHAWATRCNNEGGVVEMTRPIRMLTVFLAAMVALIVGGTGPAASAAEFKIAKIYWEYNATANDLGVHVSLDAEDWRTLKIVHPNGSTLFEVATKGAYAKFGLTEMFFEGAEPSLEDVPLKELLGLFPKGTYKFLATTVNGPIESTPTFSHAIPAGPEVSAELDEDEVIIRWKAVTGPPKGFPAERINIVGYQVIVGSFQATLPASSRRMTVPEEYVKSLKPGPQPFEVLAIEASGNQTLTEGSFTVPTRRAGTGRDRSLRDDSDGRDR